MNAPTSSDQNRLQPRQLLRRKNVKYPVVVAIVIATYFLIDAIISGDFLSEATILESDGHQVFLISSTKSACMWIALSLTCAGCFVFFIISDEDKHHQQAESPLRKIMDGFLGVCLLMAIIQGFLNVGEFFVVQRIIVAGNNVTFHSLCWEQSVERSSVQAVETVLRKGSSRGSDYVTYQANITLADGSQFITSELKTWDPRGSTNRQYGSFFGDLKKELVKESS